MNDGENRAPGMSPEVTERPQPDASWRLVSRTVPRTRRAQIRDALNRGAVRPVATLSLLGPEHLADLARESFVLFLVSGILFAALDGIAFRLNPTRILPAPGSLPLRIALILALNVVAYLLVLPLHEVVHAITILALGGRPTFGLQLPLAAYCTAPKQLFSRREYVVVALAPLVVLTLAGVIVSVLAPDVGIAVWLGIVGNIAGAVGDLWTVSFVREAPPDAIIADTATGCDAYVVDESD